MIKKKKENINYQHQTPKGGITTDPKDIKRIVRRNYKLPYADEFDNFDEMHNYFFKVPKLTQETK